MCEGLARDNHDFFKPPRTKARHPRGGLQVMLCVDDNLKPAVSLDLGSIE